MRLYRGAQRAARGRLSGGAGLVPRRGGGIAGGAQPRAQLQEERGAGTSAVSQDEPLTARGRFASTGRPPTAHSRFRIRRPGFRICPSMSVGACPLPSPRPLCPSHHWHCRRLCRLWPSASAAMMCSV